MPPRTSAQLHLIEGPACDVRWHVVMYDLLGAVDRRLQQFQHERDQLLKQEDERTNEIYAMKTVRGDAIDAIGALVLIPEGASRVAARGGAS